jgi:hypothetical protein
VVDAITVLVIIGMIGYVLLQFWPPARQLKRGLQADKEEEASLTKTNPVIGWFIVILLLGPPCPTASL